MSTQHRYAEKLLTLQTVGYELLDRLHRTYTILRSDKRPSFLNDNNYKKILTELMKKFPELPKDPLVIPGYNDQIMAKTTKLQDELFIHYYTFVDLEEWKVEALATLNDVAKNTSSLKYELNPTLTSFFLEILTLFMKLHLLLNSIDERKTVLTVYSRVFYHIKMNDEPSFQKVANYLNEYTPFVKVFISEFKGIGKRIAETLSSLHMPFVENLEVSSMRGNGIHTIINDPKKVTLPSDGQKHYNLIYSEKMYSWLSFGLLTCPENYNDISLELLRTVLQQGFLVHVHGSFNVHIHPLYDAMLKTYKPSKKTQIPKEVLKQLTKALKNAKKIVPEAEKEAIVTHGPKIHKDRRTYLRQQLTELFNIFADKPGLLGPKITLLMSGIVLARNEIVWYFNHRGTEPRGNAKLYKERYEEYVDDKITDLIYVTDGLIELIREHKEVISTYYQEFIHGLDYILCREQSEKIQKGVTDTLIQSILEEATGVTPGQVHDFNAFRLNWLRVESALSSASSVVYVNTVVGFVNRFTTITRHSYYADSILQMLDEYCNWRPLWYHLKLIEDEFLKSINPNIASLTGLQPARSIVYIKLCKYWSDSVSSSTPEMKPQIGSTCVEFAKLMINKIVGRIIGELTEIALTFETFDEQLNDKNAAYQQLRTLKQYKPQKGVTEVTLPGSESEFVNQLKLGRLKEKESVTFQLCSSLNQIVTISIYDTLFTPREFLREAIMETFGNFLTKLGGSENEVEIMRPSLIERKISSFCHVFQLIENYLDIDISNIYREVFVRNIWYLQTGDIIKLENAEEVSSIPDLKDVDTKSLFKPLIIFYRNFATNRLSATGIVWAPINQTFVSTKEMKGTSRAEDFADLIELESFCRILGPYGVKLLDREILKHISKEFIPLILSGISTNLKSCEQLNDSYYGENVFEILKTFKDLDPFVTISSALGLTLKFRELLYNALGNVVREKAYYFYDVTNSTLNQYTRNTFMVPDYMSIDLIAKYAGIDVGTADQMLKSYIGQAIKKNDINNNLAPQLPTIYAASFATKFWGSATTLYRANSEAFQNNAHVLTTTINSLILSYKATTTNENLQEIINPLSHFVEISSNILLKLVKLGQKNYQKVFGTAVNDLNPIFMFLENFVERSPFLTVDHLENCCPFILLRSMYKQIYEFKLKKNIDLDDL